MGEQEQKQIGMRLKRRRMEKGLSLKQVADATQVDWSDLSKIERGLLRLGDRRAARLAAFYGLSSERLR